MVFDDIRIALLEQNRQAPGQTELVDRYKSLLKRELADRLPEGVQPDTVVITLPQTAEAEIQAEEPENPFAEPNLEPEPEPIEDSIEEQNEDLPAIEIELPEAVTDPFSEGVDEAEARASDSDEEEPLESEAPKVEPPPGTTPRGGDDSSRRGGRFRRWRRGR